MPDITHGLAIVGPGLSGTSVAMAAGRRWPDLQVRTVDRGESLGLIGDARVVILAAPVDAILDYIPLLPSVVSPEALILDTGSTKHAIMKAARAAGITQFVGGHPRAGGTTIADASPDLFTGKPWFLTNPESPEAVQHASLLVEALGARPVVLADHGEEHDRMMAAVSHLPQVTASLLMTVVARAIGEHNLHWAGHGLRDTTRLASSPASMWQSVLASNIPEIKPLLKDLAAELDTLADRLDDPDAVRKVFDEANRAKSRV